MSEQRGKLCKAHNKNIKPEVSYTSAINYTFNWNNGYNIMVIKVNVKVKIK